MAKNNCILTCEKWKCAKTCENIKKYVKTYEILKQVNPVLLVVPSNLVNPVLASCQIIDIYVVREGLKNPSHGKNVRDRGGGSPLFPQTFFC